MRDKLLFHPAFLPVLSLLLCHNLLQFNVSVMPTPVLSNYLTKDHIGTIVVQTL